MNGTILYAEDDENDVFLMRRALKKLGFSHPLQIVSDGRLAIDYLSGREGFADRAEFPLPALVILDLKMPQVTGLEVLQWIRQQAAFAELPTVLFSSSTQPSDVVAARQLGANAYLIKPGAPNQLQDLLAVIRDQVFARDATSGSWDIVENQLGSEERTALWTAGGLG